jgi:hypothetical protein
MDHLAAQEWPKGSHAGVAGKNRLAEYLLNEYGEGDDEIAGNL